MSVLCGVERSLSTTSGTNVDFERVSRLVKRNVSMEQES